MAQYMSSVSHYLLTMPYDPDCNRHHRAHDHAIAYDGQFHLRWEDAYNNCKFDVMEEVISEDIEFYHDQGGYSTSKPQLLTAVRENICGKVTRTLKPGSIEVHEIPGYGAVQMGLHGFRNIAESGALVHYSKFIHIWKREHGKWQITRVISLH